MLIFAETGFFDLLGSPHNACVLGLHLADSPEASFADFLNDCIIIQKILLLQFYEGIPFDLYRVLFDILLNPCLLVCF